MKSTLSSAQRIAAAHPGATLPCPACAASVKATNLDRHLGEVHQLGVVWDAPHALALELSGADRRISWVLLALLVLWALGVAVLALLAALAGLALEDGPLPIALAVLLMALLGLLLLAELGRLRAQLVLDERRIALRYAFGLLRVEVALPAALESGSLWSSRQAAVAATYEHSVSEDVRVGSYLRLSRAGAAITIASSGGTQLRKHWAQRSFRSGPKRRRSDITLDRVAHVKLQYHLAALGLLSPA